MPTSDVVKESTSTLRILGVRACGTCVKAKVKCVPSLEGGKCQRCKRLDKLCQTATSSSRRKPHSMNVAHLEEKLDRLVSLFGASKAQKEVQQCSDTISSSSSLSPEAVPMVHVPVIAQSASFTSVPSRRGHGDVSNSSIESCFGLQPLEATLLLLEYRTLMAPQFPFVVVPPDISSENLHRERPMLWGAVVTAASYHDPVRQEALGWKLMEEFSSRLLIKAEKSLDLLQGLLVHLSWYHYHSAVNPQFMNLLSLAKSLVMNLGYHRTRTVKDRSRFLVDGPDGLSTPCLPIDGPLPDVRKLEEWRALAGCFFLAAMTATSCRRADPLPFTKNLEEGCKVLSEKEEYPGDRLISCLVSIQNVVVKCNSIFNETDPGHGRTPAPTRMHTSALKTELDSIMNSIPHDLRQDPKILACSQIAEISLNEYSLYNSLNRENDRTNRLNALYACLLAIKAYFDYHLVASSVVHVSHTYSQWIWSSYALLMAIKICACKAEGWDFQHAREVLKFSEVIDILLAKMEALVLLRNERANPTSSLDVLGAARDVFIRYLRHARCVKLWFEPMMKTHSEDMQGSSTTHPRGFGDTTAVMMQISQTENFGENAQDLLMDMDDSLWQLYDGNTDWMMMGI